MLSLYLVLEVRTITTTILHTVRTCLRGQKSLDNHESFFLSSFVANVIVIFCPLRNKRARSARDRKVFQRLDVWPNTVQVVCLHGASRQKQTAKQTPICLSLFLFRLVGHSGVRRGRGNSMALFDLRLILINSRPWVPFPRLVSAKLAGLGEWMRSNHRV